MNEYINIRRSKDQDFELSSYSGTKTQQGCQQDPMEILLRSWQCPQIKSEPNSHLNIFVMPMMSYRGFHVPNFVHFIFSSCSLLVEFPE